VFDTDSIEINSFKSLNVKGGGFLYLHIV